MKNLFKNLWHRMNLTKNTTQKLISLLAAIVFWIFVMDTENPEIVKNFYPVDIEYIGIEALADQDLEVVGKLIESVSVQVRGRRSDVFAMKTTDISVKVDLEGAQEGVKNYNLVVMPLVEDITVVSVDRSNLEITFDAIVSKQFDVGYETNGQIYPPYFIDRVNVEPGLVILTGPRRFINAVNQVVGYVDLEGLTRSSQTQLDLVPLNADGKAVSSVKLSHLSAQFETVVHSTKMLPVQPLQEGELDLGQKLISLDLLQTSVEITGESGLVEGVTGLYTQPINLTGLVGESVLPVTLQLPEGISLTQDQGLEVKVVIEPLVQKVLAYPLDRVIWLNESAGLNVVLEGESLNLILEGTQSDLDEVTAEEVNVMFDLAGLGAGQHRLKAMVSMTNKVKLVDDAFFLDFGLEEAQN